MNYSNYPDYISYPKFKWYNAFWFSFIPYILLIPEDVIKILPIQFQWVNLQLWLKVFIFLLPILFPSIVFLIKIIVTLINRSQKYNDLFRISKETSKIINKLKSNYPYFCVLSAGYSRQEFYIIIEGNKQYNLAPGSEVLVFDFINEMNLGRFEITDEKKKSDYYAKGIEYDKNWSKEIKQQGEVNILPGVVAMHITLEN